jgi:hypothetical protein
MIRHEVFFKYKDDAPTNAKQELEKKLLSLAQSTTDKSTDDLKIIQAYIRLHASPEGNNAGYTHILVMTFATAEDRDRYLSHPRHQAVLKFLQEHPIVEKFVAIDHEEPITPRRAKLAAEQALQRNDLPALKRLAHILEALTLEMAKNPSAFGIYLDNMLVTSPTEVRTTTHSIFAEVSRAITESPDNSSARSASDHTEEAADSKKLPAV